MQNSQINWDLLVINRVAQDINHFPEGKKVKWPNNEGTPENV